jgi:hypothetical protein
MRFQKKTKIKKLNFSAKGIHHIKDKIERDACKFNVSKSFVICVILAQHYDIKEQEEI